MKNVNQSVDVEQIYDTQKKLCPIHSESKELIVLIKTVCWSFSEITLQTSIEWNAARWPLIVSVDCIFQVRKFRDLTTYFKTAI